MKILITHFFSKKNKGDAAINTVLVHELKKKYPKAHIVLSSTDAFAPGERFEGVLFVSSILYEALYVSVHPVTRILRTLYVLVASLLWVLTKKRTYVPDGLRGFLEALSTADLVVPTGGSYLMASSSIQSNIVLILQLWPIFLAKLLNKKVVMYAQSIGPFENGFGRTSARYVLDTVASIEAREPITKAILLALGVNKPTITVSADAAFLFSSKFKKTMKEFLNKKGATDSKIKVGITVKRCYDDIRQEKYEKSIGGLVQHLIEKYDAQVIFVPQCTSTLHNDDDRVVSRAIVKSMQSPKNVFLLEDEFDHYHIKSLFENLDYLVATRMHSAIFAITGHVPTLAIAYEHKTKGTMEALGLSKWCIDLADVNFTSLTQKFDALYENN